MVTAHFGQLIGPCLPVGVVDLSGYAAVDRCAETVQIIGHLASLLVGPVDSHRVPAAGG